MQTDNIDRISEILSDLPRLLFNISGGSTPTLKMELGGDSHGRSLLSRSEVSVLIWDIEPDSQSYRHMHDVTEWIIVHAGAIDVFGFRNGDQVISNSPTVDGRITLNAGGFVAISPSVGHVVSSKCGASTIIVVVPRGAEFPV